MLSHEEMACRQLCDELMGEIKAVQAESVPAERKKGLGPEVLSLTQALMRVQSESGSSCRLQCRGLLSGAVAVIDSMQRSSGKQFASVCSWQAAFAVRAARERFITNEVQTVVQSEQSQNWASRLEAGVDRCVDLLVRVLIDGELRSSLSSIPKKVKSKVTDNGTGGPRDVEHILMILMAQVSAIGYCPSPDAVSDIITHLFDFLLNQR
jgi:hypothetical protein